MDEQTCRVCSGQLEEKLVTRLQQYEGRWILIENVPALVCSQCGEKYYTPAAHDLVLKIIMGDREPVRTEEVAVYDATLRPAS